MKVSRRKFLVSTASLPVLMNAFPGLSLAGITPTAPSVTSKNFFVLITMLQGWDVTLSLDPWVMPEGCDDKDMFIEYRPDEILANPKFPNLKLGPAAKSILPYAGDCTIINGVVMNDVDNGHTANIGYICTGDGEGKAADIPVEINFASYSGTYGVVFDGGVYQGTRQILLSSANDIINSQNAIQFSAFFTDFLKNQTSASSLKTAQSAYSQSAPGTAKVIQNLQRFSKAGTQLQSEHAVAAAFLANVSYQAKLDLTGQTLDTHSGHPKNHLAAQSQLWDRIAGIFKLFKTQSYGAKGESLFDHTTFMVVSEFSRTPALNSAQGKDHNPLTNSVLLAGRGFNRGQALGSSLLVPRGKTSLGMPNHVGAPIDYKTGTVLKTRTEAQATNAQYIFPQNVVRTVAKIAGADMTKFNAVPETTSILPWFDK